MRTSSSTARRSLCIALALSLTCLSATARAALNVFTCEPEWAALAAEIGGTQVETYSATTGLQDPHHIEARPGLIAKLRNASLLICTGSGLEEGWLPALLRQAGNPRVQPGMPGYIEAAAHVALLEVPANVDRALGDMHPQGNPHLHLDPRRVAQVAAIIAQRLSEIDRDNATLYRDNVAAFTGRWHAAIARWEQSAARLRGAAIIAHHKDWVYLVDWLGMREAATLEPLPGLPPTVAHLTTLTTRFNADNVLAIVRTPYQNTRGSEWLGRQTGIPAVVLPYTVGGTPAARDLFTLFDETLRLLMEQAR